MHGPPAHKGRKVLGEKMQIKPHGQESWDWDDDTGEGPPRLTNSPKAYVSVKGKTVPVCNPPKDIWPFPSNFDFADHKVVTWMFWLLADCCIAATGKPPEERHPGAYNNMAGRR